MFKRKEKKQPQKEFTEMDMPHNRFQVFWDLFKHRSRFLLIISFYNLMFVLPLFLWNAFMNQAIWNLIGETEKNIGTILSYVCTKDAISVVCSMFLGFSIAGSFKIIQKLIYICSCFKFAACNGSSKFFNIFSWQFIITLLQCVIKNGINCVCC